MFDATDQKLLLAALDAIQNRPNGPANLLLQLQLEYSNCDREFDSETVEPRLWDESGSAVRPGRPTGRSQGAVHGRAGWRSVQRASEGVLRTSPLKGKEEEGGPDCLHAEAADSPQQPVPEGLLQPQSKGSDGSLIQEGC